MRELIPLLIAHGVLVVFLVTLAARAGAPLPAAPLLVVAGGLAAAGRISLPACLRAKATTSGRRWEKHGVLRTVLAMWWLRLRYAFGADPNALARAYGYEPRDA